MTNVLADSHHLFFGLVVCSVGSNFLIETLIAIWWRKETKNKKKLIRKKNHNNRIEMRNGIINERRKSEIKKKQAHTTIFVVFQSNWIRVVFINSLLLAPKSQEPNSLHHFLSANKSQFIAIYTQSTFYHCCLLFLAWFHDYCDC